jgi:hypothetical protein
MVGHEGEVLESIAPTLLVLKARRTRFRHNVPSLAQEAALGMVLR